MIAIRPKLVASYLCATLVLLVGLAAFVQAYEASQAMERSARLRTTIRTALEVELLVLNAESAQRGYLLTSDPRYLTPYDEATSLIKAKIESLSELLSRSPGQQQQRVAQLLDHTERKFEELASTLEQRQRLRSDVPTKTLFKDDVGQLLGEEIRRDVNSIIQAARTERDEEDAQASRLHLFTRWFVGIGNAAAFLLAATITAWIGAGFREEARLRRNLEHANTALQRSNDDLEQFAYVASHDLRAPLRGISSLTEWILEDLGNTLTPETAKHFAALQGRVRRLDALVVGIAAYSRAGRAYEVPERIDTGRLAHEVIDLVAPPKSAHLSVADNLPTIDAPRVPLQQVLLNLVSNAVKHGLVDGTGDIAISCAEEERFWRFSVRDHGPGIAPEYHQKIFDLFQTLASRDRVEGTGIGLAVVKKLVGRYGGAVTVNSALNEGTTVSFTWPKRPPTQETERQSGEH